MNEQIWRTGAGDGRINTLAARRALCVGSLTLITRTFSFLSSPLSICLLTITPALLRSAAAENRGMTVPTTLVFADLDFDTFDRGALEVALRQVLGEIGIADAASIAITYAKGSVIATIWFTSQAHSDTITAARAEITGKVRRAPIPPRSFAVDLTTLFTTHIFRVLGKVSLPNVLFHDTAVAHCECCAH